MKFKHLLTTVTFRLMALMLCLAATLPQLQAADYNYTIYVRCSTASDASSTNLYSWGNGISMNWPGIAISGFQTESVNGYTWYRTTLSSADSEIGVIFNRNGSQTSNLKAYPGNNYYVYNGSTAVTYDYFVVGDDTSIFPNGWSRANSTMMSGSGNNYTWTSGEVHLDAGTTYEYKVTGSDNSWYPSGNNATFSVQTSGTYTVTITFNKSNGSVQATPNLVHADETYNYTFYVLLPNGGTPYLYVWNGNDMPLGNSPGQVMGNTETLADGNSWYKTTVSCTLNPLSAIVSLGQNANRTADLNDLAPGTYYITWDGSDRTGHTISQTAPTAPVYYYVVGNDTGIFPNGWSDGSETLMTENNGTYSWTANGVHLTAGTTYTYKVHNSQNSWYPSGDNATFTVDRSGTYNVLFTFDGTDVNAVPSLQQEDPTYSYTFYVRLTNGGTPYLYTWNGDYRPNGNWPGTQLSETETLDDNNSWYKITSSYYNNSMSAIVNLGQDSNQSADMENIAPGTYYITWDGGDHTQATITTEAPTAIIDYYVVGEDTNIFPNGWSTGSETLMTDNNGTYSWTANGVHLTAGTTYTYKVLGTDNMWHPTDGNATFTVDRSGTYNVLFTFDGTDVNAVPSLQQENPTYSYTFYVRLTNGGTPYLYTWNGDYRPNGSWPGSQLSETETLDDNNSWYKITSSYYNNSMSAIVNLGQDSNQSANMENIAPGTYYITWDGGDHTQATITTEAPTAIIDYYVVGADTNIFPNGWSTGSETLMTDNGDGTYTWVIPEVHLTAGETYEYKVHSSEDNWYPADGNATFSVTTSGTYSVTFTYNTDGNVVNAETSLILPDPVYITGSNGLGLTWGYAPTTAMTYDANVGAYKYTCTITEAGTYGFVFGTANTAESWDQFNSNYRVGPNSGDEVIALNSNWIPTQMADGDNGAYQVHVDKGTVTIYFNPVTMEFKVEGKVPVNGYTFYILPTDGTTQPRLYLWAKDGTILTNPYPGTPLETTVTLHDNRTWYVWSDSLTVDIINAIVNGGGDESKTKNITNIAPGTYYIIWSTERGPEDEFNYYELYNVEPQPVVESMYLHGGYYHNHEIFEYRSDMGSELKYDANTGNYYINNVTLSSNSTFCFTTHLGLDWQSVGTRYGNGGTDYTTNPTGGTNYLEVTSSMIGTHMPLDEWSLTYGEYKMFTAGVYNILMNPTEKWVMLIKTDHASLSPMNVYLEQTPNVEIDNVQEPNTDYTVGMFDGYWPLSAYNQEQGFWDPTSDSRHYPVTYIGVETTADGKTWWHWQVYASIADVFFTRTNDRQPLQSDTITRHAGVMWYTWDEIDGQTVMTDHSHEYFEAAANALPTNAVVMEGHYYVYFVNTIGWDNVYCYAWDIAPGNYADGYSRVMENNWPGHPCELIGIDPVTGYEVWRYDFGIITDNQVPDGILFNDGNVYAQDDSKEQTGNFQFINGGVYDYLGLLDGAYTLNNLIRNAAEEVRYTVSNDLLGVYYDPDAKTVVKYKNNYDEEVSETIYGALYAKDLNMYGEKSIKPDDSYTDYVYETCASTHTAGGSQVMDKKTTYDQSNWVKLIMSPNYDGRSGVPVSDSERPKLKDYVGYLIPAGTLDVFMTDTINPEAHVLSISKGRPMKYEPNVYISGHFNDTVVFNYTHQEWQPGEYNGNYRTKPVVNWHFDDEGNAMYGDVTRERVYEDPYYMFYVAPKPQELAYISWIVYDNYNRDGVYSAFTNGVYTPVTRPASALPEDPGRFYAPRNWDRSIRIDGSEYENLRYLSGDSLTSALGGYGQEYGPYSNGYMQYGGVKVNWSLFDTDSVEMRWWDIFEPGQAYKLLAIVRYARGNDVGYEYNECYGPGNGDSGDDETVNVMNAPRRADDNGQGRYANMYFTGDYAGLEESKFIIFPILASPNPSNGDGMGNVTTVKEVTTSRYITGVRYYNLMGVESTRPFEGINIVVTTYSDGSRTSRKILR